MSLATSDIQSFAVGTTSLPAGRRRARPVMVPGLQAAAGLRRRERFATHRYAQPVVRELPRSYARCDDATW